MPTWNLDETREHVTRLFGRGQLDLAAPSITSVDDRQTYARIHFFAARSAIEVYLLDELQDTSLLEITFGGDSERWDKFNIFTREVGAHLTACVQSMHAVPDILGHAIHYSLGFNLLADAMKSRDIRAYSVSAQLKRDAKYATLAALFDQLIAQGDFGHLSALANQAKHRSIVLPSLNEDLTGERATRYVITFPRFECKGNTYKLVVAEEFLKAEFARASALVVKIGCELNALLLAHTV